MPRRPFAVIAVVACLLAGCSDDDKSEEPKGSASASERSPAAGALRNLVTDEDLKAVSASSPEHALLKWFQAVQFRDPEGVVQLTDPAEVRRVKPSRISTVVKRVGPALGKPSIVTVRRAARSANVRVIIEGFAGNRQGPTVRTAESFDLTLEGKTWRLSDVSYLTDAAAALNGSN